MSNIPRESERRKSERVPLVIDLYYKVDHPPELKIKFRDCYETANLVDISKNGLGFNCGTILPRLSELDITFNLLAVRGDVVKIKTIGVVRYCSYQSDKQMYRIGLVFSLIDEVEEQLIAGFVRNFRKDGA